MTAQTLPYICYTQFNLIRVRHNVNAYQIGILRVTRESDILIHFATSCYRTAITNCEFIRNVTGVSPGSSDVVLLRGTYGGIIWLGILVIAWIRRVFLVESVSDANDNNGIKSAERGEKGGRKLL